MRKSVWDHVYENHGDVLNMTRNEVYEMTLDELAEIIHAEEQWSVEHQCWINTRTGKKIEQ